MGLSTVSRSAITKEFWSSIGGGGSAAGVIPPIGSPANGMRSVSPPCLLQAISVSTDNLRADDEEDEDEKPPFPIPPSKIASTEDPKSGRSTGVSSGRPVSSLSLAATELAAANRVWEGGGAYVILILPLRPPQKIKYVSYEHVLCNTGDYILRFQVPQQYS